MPARAQRENRHAEGISRIHQRLPEGEKLLERQVQLFREVAEVAAHHFARESIVPGRHRGVRSENIRRRGFAERGLGRGRIPPAEVSISGVFPKAAHPEYP